MKIPKGAKVKNKKIKLTVAQKVDEMSVIVHVTKADIAKGIKGSPKTCAIAQSLTRQFNEQDVRVLSDRISVDGFSSIWASSWKKIGEFIDAFDDGKPVKPFSFKLKLKSKSF